jgi:AraC-like DNA-binding protein
MSDCDSMAERPERLTNRPNAIDPFLDLIRLLRPQATLWGTIRGSGRWGVGFRERHDLLFFRVDRGKFLLLRANEEPVPLGPGDFVLIRTVAPFVLASDRQVEPVDSETLVATTRSTTMRVGLGKREQVTIRGGRFVFDTANEELLVDLLPPLVHVAVSKTKSARVLALLSMNEEESNAPGPASDFVVVRLMELLLVELLRGPAFVSQPTKTGMIQGLADPVTARALIAMHGDPEKSWTTSKLARLCGCSRSAFNLRFTSIVGIAPIGYLHRWRMVVAKDELRRGERSIAEIAFLIGFQSGGAFTRAFTRSVGCSPTCFVGRHRLYDKLYPKQSLPKAKPLRSSQPD